MGDTGSLTLGYILAFLAIAYTNNNSERAPYTEGAIVVAFSTLIVPIFDVFRVILVRARNHKGLFNADRNHIHHKFFLHTTLLHYLIFIICFFRQSIVTLLYLLHSI